MKPERKPRPARRFVHLGERLDAIARVRGGEALASVAIDLGVTPDDVGAWVLAHAEERVHSLDEMRSGGTPEHMRLTQRARRLADLVAESERTLRNLHQELLCGISPSNDEEAEPSKELGVNSHSGAQRVAPSQRSAARTRKFVDGDSTR